MAHVYVVQEGFSVHTEAFTTYAEAKVFVLAKYAAALKEEEEEVGEGWVNDVDVPENPGGTTYCFIESMKLSINIIRLPVRTQK